MFSGLIRSMRPTHWIKNGFLFAGLIFDKQLMNGNAFGRVLMGTIIFSLAASVVYLINDLRDIEADRQHERKKHRPIAAGVVPIIAAQAAWVILLLVVLPSSYLLSPQFAAITAGYIGLNLVYSVSLKHVPIFDLLLLAGFYVMRVAAGLSLIEAERFSPWLYVFTTFLALFLGVGKRRSELASLKKSKNNQRKVLDSYTLQFLDQLLVIVLTLTIFTYSLYTFSAPNLPDNNIMMLTIPFVIYGVFRYLYLIQVKDRGEAPEKILLSDLHMQATVILWGISVLVIFYFG